MDNFSRFVKHKKVKLGVVSVSIVLPIVIIVLLEVFKDFFKSSAYNDLIVFRYFFFIIVEGWLITKIVYYLRIIYNEDFGKNAFIKLTDERLSYVRMRASALCFKLVLYFILLALIVCGFYSREIFYTLVIVLGVSILTYFFAYLYYKKKF